jgi:tetratricopeptide (TPR) repeat protein
VRGYGNLASILYDIGELERSAEMIEQGLVLAKRFGLWEPVRWLGAERAWIMYDDGRWDEALEILDELIAEVEDMEFWMEPSCRCLRGRLRVGRGDPEGGRADAIRALEGARVGKDPQVVWPALAIAAWSHLGTDPSLADTLATELLESWRAGGLPLTGTGEWLLYLVEAFRVLGRQAEILETKAGSTVPGPWVNAAMAYAAGDFVRAAEVYAAVGAKADEAYARLRAAEAFVDEGRRAEADAQLDSSLSFWRMAGASAYIREGEALLAESA